MAGEDIADVFAAPDLWKTSRWVEASPLRQHEFFDLDLKRLNSSHLVQASDDEIPDGQSNEFFGLPTIWEPVVLKRRRDESDDEISPSPGAPRQATQQDIDLFNDACIGRPETPSVPGYKSWDGFALPDIPPVEPLFITEAGARSYDVALLSPDDPLGIQESDHHLVETSPYITALLALALGRTSIFFTYDEKAKVFVPELDKLRISGFSSKVLQALQSKCLQSGNISRFLYVFVQIMYRTHPSAARIALAKAVDSLLLVIQTKLGYRARKIGSLLQLQAAVQPVHTILAHFESLVTKLNKGRTDEQMLSILFEETQALEDGNSLLGDIMREVLARVSEPWADFTQKWIGAKAEEGNPMTKDGPGKSFVRVENVVYMDGFGMETEEPDYILDARRVPNFVPDDVARTMFETGKTLRLLRTHHPEHVLCRTELVQSKGPPKLQWHYDWRAIELLQRQVNDYETSLMQAIHDYRIGQVEKTQDETSTPIMTYSLELFGQQESQLADRLMASIKEMNKPLEAPSSTDKLSQLIHDRLFAEKEDHKLQGGLALIPHWSLLPLLSFGPLVEAQARLVNREYMKLLFNSHRLRDHIALQKSFQLLGNGLFCSRLSHALFDADLETAERQAGVARKGGAMGLRLGTRDTWPPASSELRLALMGVLTEAYFPAVDLKTRNRETDELPGDLSFAVRDLSDEEIEKCINPGSLEALDFLRLSYKPPAPLAPIMTPVVLVKFDKIFKMLLRLLRMLHVTGELFRDTLARTSRWSQVDDVCLRFRIEAQHFTSSIAAYFFDSGIGLPWMKFENWLDEVQSGLEKDDMTPNTAPIVSPDGLRERQEQVLDSIMHTLLLRKRQQPVLKVLEEIFTLILRFSKLARTQALGGHQGGPEDVFALYSAFKKGADVFITVCRGLSEKGGQSSKAQRHDLMSDEGRTAAKEENTIDRLLLQLEMSGHYGGPRRNG
ncbi:hypothetical protein JX266_004835 [Neoarthrinium moseri]|nr:hypothetical protein JX266_004835 [Neoarthrinium moseri]